MAVTVKELADKLSLKAVNDIHDKEIHGVFISDMLSDVMAGAQAGNVWVTVQTHKNTVAAANLVDISAIIIARGKAVPEDTVQMADRVGLTVFTTELDSYQIAVQLYEAGLKP
jgi:serine kinase of HPr protein (carbohydrate metabolism regulator)